VSTNDVERHYNLGEVAGLLGGVSKQTVQRAIKPGNLWPVVRLSRKVVLVPASVLHRYLAEHTWDPKPLASRK
jgi:hypothetical protein